MESSMLNSLGGAALIVTSLLAFVALIVAGAVGLYQRYKQNRYWDNFGDEKAVVEFYPPGEAEPETPECYEESADCGCLGPSDGAELFAGEKQSIPHQVDNPAKLPMPKGYQMEAEMYKHSVAAVDTGFTKMNTEMAEAMEEAKLIDSNMKRLRQIIHEEIAKSGVLMPSGTITNLASEYEKLPYEDLRAHGRAVVKALKAQERAKADATRDIKSPRSRTKTAKKPKSSAKSKSKSKKFPVFHS